MKLMAVYGSLRSGHYNNTILEARNVPLVRQETLRGWKLVCPTGAYYPAAVRTGDVMDKVVIEVFDMAQEPELMRRIRNMEYAAGYKEAKIDTDAGEAVIFEMDSADAESWNFTNEVPDGDWSNYKGVKAIWH